MTKLVFLTFTVYLVKLITAGIVISAEKPQQQLGLIIPQTTEFPVVKIENSHDNNTRQQLNIAASSITNDVTFNTNDIPTTVKETQTISEKEQNLVSIVSSVNKQPPGVIDGIGGSGSDLETGNSPEIPSSISLSFGSKFDNNAQNSLVNQTNSGDIVISSPTETNAVVTTTTTQKPKLNGIDQLIPPADVNASIAKIDEPPSRKGQLIIRLAEIEFVGAQKPQQQLGLIIPQTTEFPVVKIENSHDNNTRQQLNIAASSITNDVTFNTNDIPTTVKETQTISEKEQNLVSIVSSVNKQPPGVIDGIGGSGSDLETGNSPEIPSSISLSFGSKFDNNAQNSLVNQTNSGDIVISSPTETNAVVTTTTTQKPKLNGIDQLIPPADVNASIAKIDEPPSRKGQLIIRLAEIEFVGAQKPQQQLGLIIPQTTEFPVVRIENSHDNNTRQQLNIAASSITNDVTFNTNDRPTTVKETQTISEKEQNLVSIVSSVNKQPPGVIDGIGGSGSDLETGNSPEIPSSISLSFGSKFDNNAQNSLVNQTNSGDIVISSPTETNAVVTTTTTQKPKLNGIDELIPPADVNASIAKIDEPPSRKGQLIISSSPDCPSLAGADDMSHTQLIQALTHACRYDRLDRPNITAQNGERAPVDVYVRLYFYFLQNLEAHDLQFKIQALLQLRFVDPRLVLREVSPKRTTPIMGEASLRSAIWVPHIFLVNEKDSSILGTEDKDILTSISPDGTVIISARIQATLSCWMNLQKFPFDEQECSTVLESWIYNTSELVMHWEPKSPVTLAPKLQLTEYVLLNSWINETVVNADTSDLSHGAFAGNYSSLTYTIHLAREMGYYLMDYFLPSMMIVAISWVSFWVQADQVAPRIMLGTTTMLTFITLASAQGKTLPKVSYIKVSEVWFLGCTGFIFGSLVEFAFVNSIWRRKKNVELKKVNSKYILKSTLTPRPRRKEVGLQKSRSCSDLDASHNPSTPATPTYNNYLTVHSFNTKSNFNLPTITTQSVDDVRRNGDMTIAIDASSSVTSLNGGNKDGADTPGNDNNHYGWTTMTPQEISTWIDRRSRLVFPCAFIVFNAFFWTFVYCL